MTQAAHKLNFLDSLRYRGSKSRIEQTTIRGGFPRLVATAAENCLNIWRIQFATRQAKKAPAERGRGEVGIRVSPRVTGDDSDGNGHPPSPQRRDF